MPQELLEEMATLLQAVRRMQFALDDRHPDSLLHPARFTMMDLGDKWRAGWLVDDVEKCWAMIYRGEEPVPLYAEHSSLLQALRLAHQLGREHCRR